MLKRFLDETIPADTPLGVARPLLSEASSCHIILQDSTPTFPRNKSLPTWNRDFAASESFEDDPRLYCRLTTLSLPCSSRVQFLLAVESSDATVITSPLSSLGALRFTHCMYTYEPLTNRSVQSLQSKRKSKEDWPVFSTLSYIDYVHVVRVSSLSPPLSTLDKLLKFQSLETDSSSSRSIVHTLRVATFLDCAALRIVCLFFLFFHVSIYTLLPRLPLLCIQRYI